jgi:hypothetical protein
MWMWPAATALPLQDPPASVVYRVLRRGTRTAVIEARNRGTQAVTLTWTLPSYAPPTAVAHFQLAPGASASQELAVSEVDQDLMHAVVAKPGVTPAPPGEAPTAYGVVATSEDPRFAAALLVYTLQADAQGRLDARLRWDGDRPLHAAWRIVGRPEVVTPRLHLLPGRTEEVVLAQAAAARTPRRIIEIYNVRVGEDAGPLTVPDAALTPVVLPERDGWRPAMPIEWTNPAWNAPVVHWRAETRPDGTLAAAWLWNRSAAALRLRYDQAQVGLGGVCELNPGAELRLPVAAGIPVARLQSVWVQALSIDGLTPPPAWTGTNPVLPPGCRPTVVVTAGIPDFNPQQLQALPRAAGTGVEVVLVNTHAIALRGTLRLGDVSTPFALAAGTTGVVPLPGLRFSLRLAASDVQVADVQTDGVK